MDKIVIIGRKEDILLYQSIGIFIEPVKTATETIASLTKLTQDPMVKILLIAEDMAEQCLSKIAEVRKKTGKVITILPTHETSRQIGKNAISKEIKRVIGIQIFAEQ